MGVFDWFTKPKEDRSLVNYSTNHSSGAIFSVFSTGTPVSEQEAMKIPAVVSCIELIAGSIAQLPVYLYKENENGDVEKIADDKRVFLINDEPNDMMNGYTFKKRIVKDYLFYGVSYTKHEMVRNDVVELYPFDMENVQVTKYLVDGYKYDADIRLITYVNDGQRERIFKPHEVIPILRDSNDGITGRGVLMAGEKTLQLALSEVEYSNNILKNGALPIGVLQTANKVSEIALKRLRAGWESLYGGSKNAGKTVLLEEGIEYKPISLKPNDMQLVDSKKVTLADITRLFNIPESMLNADANKYASNEQNNLYFLQYTLAPIINAIESAFNRSLLLEDEKNKGYYFRFDVSEILRTTEKEKIESAAIALSKGIISLNETRAKLDLPKLDENYFIWSLGNVLFNPETKEITVPNMMGNTDLDDPQQSVDQAKQNTEDLKNTKAQSKVPSENKNQPNKQEDDKKEQTKKIRGSQV